ncbi:MAG: hypothetical protein ABR564_03650, partial [Candidatus Dormibacteria bacterium]
AKSRRRALAGFRRLLATGTPDGRPSAFPWQKHYFRGTAPDGRQAPEHQLKLALRDFSEAELMPAARRDP